MATRRFVRWAGILGGVVIAYACGSVERLAPDAAPPPDTSRPTHFAVSRSSIYVADAAANARIERFDDFTGTGWTSYGTMGN